MLFFFLFPFTERLCSMRKCRGGNGLVWMGKLGCGGARVSKGGNGRLVSL